MKAANKRRIRRLGLGVAGAAGAYASVAVVLALMFPLPLPDASLAPRAGDRLVSRWENVEQEILAVEDGWVLSNLVLLPHAEGPPPHYHESFDEVGIVTEGVLSVEIDGERREVHAGESFRFPKGVYHRPFNTTDQRVVVRARGRGIPLRFATCLSQLYAFVDEPGNQGPRIALQMSLMRSYCDVHRAPPIVERVVFGALAPVARASGLQSFYPEYAPPRLASGRASDVSISSPPNSSSSLGGSKSRESNMSSVTVKQ